jgi:hypothetical protein
MRGAEMEGWVTFTLIGLAADIAGAYYLAAGLFISKDEAIRLGVTRWAGDADEENLRLPAVKDRLRQADRAKRGVTLLIAGFFLQAVGSLLSASGG